MRFQRLQIPAFGPFVNLELHFHKEPLDLHLVYGANEAGKSSLLRAIRDLLFGIPGQSNDNFLHDYTSLRIKGEVQNSSGQSLTFQRRKGNKNTLLDGEGVQLADSVLTPFLGNVDERYFCTMFGLGARELEEGAQQLLRGEGDVGTALFSASLGGTPVQKVLESLQEQAQRLYRGRATANVIIRPTATRYKELLKQSKDAMVSPETWETVERELAAAQEAKQQLERDISTLELQMNWLDRCEDALPTVGLLAECVRKLALLPPLPDLAADFVQRAQVARGNLDKAQTQVETLSGRVQQLREQLSQCSPNLAVLAASQSIDHLHQQLGSYRDRTKLLGDLQLRLAGLRPQLEGGIQNLGFAGDVTLLDAHRITHPVQLACDEAAKALEETTQQQSKNTADAQSYRLQIESKSAELNTLQETNFDDIREALTVAAEATEADRTLPTAETDVRRLQRETAALHKLVSGAPPDFESAAGLPVPANATIRRYHTEMEALTREIAGVERELKEHSQRTESIQTDLTRLERQGELPSEEVLRRARKHRDYGWQLVLADWKGEGTTEEFEPGHPLEIAFPRAIAKADEIVDRLRDEAEAVVQAEERRSQLKELQAQTSRASENLLRLRKCLGELQDAWKEQWSGCTITPASPLEMEEWRQRWQDFRTLLAQLHNAQELLQTKQGQVARAKERLGAVLGQPPTKEFSLLFAAARNRVQAAEQTAGRRIEMENQLNQLQTNLKKVEQDRGGLEEALRLARKNWDAQCARAGIPTGTSPAAGRSLLDARRKLLGQFDQWKELVNQEEAARQAIHAYTEALKREVSALALDGDSVEALEGALWQALDQARTCKTRHDQLEGQIQLTLHELSTAKIQADQSGKTLNSLVLAAGLPHADELEPLLAHLEQRNGLQTQISNLRNTLAGLARGQGVDEFLHRVEAENAETLSQRRACALADKNRKNQELHPLGQTLFGLMEQRKSLEKAGDTAADLRQQAESCAAQLRADATEYLRLRLATHLLQSHIERFRKANQGPLLQRSGEVFKAITRGSFEGLSAHFYAEDTPVLVGVRPDTSLVPVEGLSEGSRDQLYLALRLAALDKYLEEHEPMPIILDDLLITCDNERAKAILPQLQAMAKRTQVFLFTHHEHLVELCRTTLGEGRFHLHRLGAGPL